MPVIKESTDRLAMEAGAARLRDGGIAADVLSGEVAGDVITNSQIVVAEEDREAALALLDQTLELPEDPEFVDENGEPSAPVGVEFGGLAFRIMVVSFFVIVILLAALLMSKG